MTQKQQTRNLEIFFEAYLECALWCSADEKDEPLDSIKYAETDWDLPSKKKMRNVCEMKTALLHLSRRLSNGVRLWSCPGSSNPITLIPARLSFSGSMTVRFPWTCKFIGPCVKSLQLPKHRTEARKDIIVLIEETRNHL